MLRRLSAIAAVTLLPVAGFAASDETSPPKPTNTTKKCFFGKVWDEEQKKCVKPEETNFSDAVIMQNVRELAYFGRVQDAQALLSLMSDQSDDLVLTYWGFTHRVLGNEKASQTFYNRAIRQNPDNVLARSYMAQGFVKDGKIGAAHAQLEAIRNRGGAGTWAETSLSKALKSGETFNY